MKINKFGLPKGREYASSGAVKSLYLKYGAYARGGGTGTSL
jgi:hypothetical protein